MMTRVNCVVLTYLQPYFMKCVRAVNDQTIPFAGRYLVVDRKASPKWSEAHEAAERCLDDWNVLILDPGGDWGSYRNRILDMLPRDQWVLMLDDDEVISRRCMAQIERTVASSRGSVDAYLLPRNNTFAEDLDKIPAIDWTDPNGQNYPDWQGRLFLNNGVIHYVGCVHETLNGYRGLVGVDSPNLTLLHHKTPEMQAASNVRWRRLERNQPEASTGAQNGSLGETNIPPARFYSQCGEDEFLANLLPSLTDVPQTMVELGAGDPLDLSNSRYLIEQGWTTLLVEANPELVDRLQREYESHPKVCVSHSLVGPTEEGTVDFHVSHVHWALSGVGGVSQVERHSMADVTVIELPQSRGSDLVKDWLSSINEERLGVLGIDLEGLDTKVLAEILHAEVNPCVIVIEALTAEDREAQQRLLAQAGYLFEANRALSDIYVHESVARSMS